MPTPQTQRELPLEEIMERAVQAEGEDEEQMRSLMPPDKTSTEDKDLSAPELPVADSLPRPEKGAG